MKKKPKGRQVKTSPTRKASGANAADRPKLNSETIAAALDAAKLPASVVAVMNDLGAMAAVERPPISIPILSGAAVSSRVRAAASAADSVADSEPVYGPEQRANIQGNTIPGFNKDHQHFLFFRIGAINKCKAWLRGIAPRIASLEEVLAFVRAHRALRLRMGVKEPPLSSCWVNIAFSHGGIAKLVGQSDADKFSDQSFRQGLSERSTFIGDPADPKQIGHRRHWVVGGPKNTADILVIVAADDVAQLNRTVEGIRDDASKSKLKLIFEQRGDSLPGDLRGHEHFGFKDGISQPAVRGRVSSAADDFIAPRYLDPSDPRSNYFAKPGQPLVWPGEFLLGEVRQDPENLVTPASALDPANYPEWARLGSYLVCRRLLQDVPAFWQFSAIASQTLGIDAKKFASMLVGRWPSGAPIMRSPNSDNPMLATDDWANNHFLYDDHTRPSNLIPIAGYGGDTFPQAQADVLGAVCPHFAHIRKMNTRDMATDLGKPQDTVIRLILRRGIPFGKPVIGVKRPSKSLLKEQRGLMFVCYGATIEEQFEFLSRRWANSSFQPNEGGHDPIIGQASDGRSRERFIDFPTNDGLRRIPMPRDWVVPSGGGYFFSPPIQAIAGVLGA